MSARELVASLDPILDDLDVVGLPAPQGSKRHVGGGRMVESSAKVAPWRETVAAAVVGYVGPGWQPLTGPLYLGVDFYLPCPKSRIGERYAVTGPDLDKLVRSTCDALTMGGLWADDKQAVEIHAVKLWTTEARPYPGARISVAMLRRRA